MIAGGNDSNYNIKAGSPSILVVVVVVVVAAVVVVVVAVAAVDTF